MKRSNENQVLSLRTGLALLVLSLLATACSTPPVTDGFSDVSQSSSTAYSNCYNNLQISGNQSICGNVNSGNVSSYSNYIYSENRSLAMVHDANEEAAYQQAYKAYLSQQTDEAALRDMTAQWNHLAAQYAQ